LKQDVPVVLAGDYKCRADRARYLSDQIMDKDALIQPKSRAAFKALSRQGWTDAIANCTHKSESTHSGNYKKRKSLAARRRPPARSSPAQSRTGAAPRESPASTAASAARKRQRPRAGVVVLK